MNYSCWNLCEICKHDHTNIKPQKVFLSLMSLFSWNTQFNECHRPQTPYIGSSHLTTSREKIPFQFSSMFDKEKNMNMNKIPPLNLISDFQMQIYKY